LVGAFGFYDNKDRVILKGKTQNYAKGACPVSEWLTIAFSLRIWEAKTTLILFKKTYFKNQMEIQTNFFRFA